MWFVFGLIVLSALFTAIILPWVNRSKIQDLADEINRLQKQLSSSASILSEEKSQIPSIAMKSSKDSVIEAVITKKSNPIINKNSENNKKNSFELQFGARLPVWIGGIALVLAGFYMVKYSIEEGLLNPSIRTSLGMIFGIILLYVANLIRDNSKVANGKRIAQALSGAGIADLYICVFAATNLYDILPDFIGFIGLTIVTITAVFLSLKHGMPIALLGLVGGLLTPAMVSAKNPSTAMLFIYLYFVVAGLIWTVRRKNWWILAFPAVIGAFIWVLFWLYGGYYSSIDTIWLGLFLIAISGTIIVSSRDQLIAKSCEDKVQFNSTNILSYITLGGTVFIAALIASFSGFGNFEWGLFALLSFAGIALAYFDQKHYGFLPLLSMLVISTMLVIWSTYDKINFAIVISAFSLLYIGAGYLIQRRCNKPLQWSVLVCVTAIIYYMVAYYKLKYAVFLVIIPHFWSILALLFSVLSLGVLQRTINELPVSHVQKQHMMSAYALTITAFISMAFAIEIPQDFLVIALSAEVMAIAWIKTKFDIKALKLIAMILSCIIAFLLIPQILMVFQLSVYSLIEARLYFQKLLVVTNPLLQLGLPALFLGVSSYFFRGEKDGKFVRYLELSSIILISLMGYYLIREVFHTNTTKLFIKATFIERGVITNVIFIFGLLCLQIGNHFSRQVISSSGLIFSLSAIFRIIYFDYLSYNPLWSEQEVGSFPILNSLLITYGFPILWAWKFGQELVCLKRFKLANYNSCFILLNLFILISLSLRQLFQGSLLNSKVTSLAEIYSYSIIWLVFGIALLFFGVVSRNKMTRKASLLVIIITIGKVFLYDAAALEGLYRVFSFFGLGICLLVLSWFYSKFVFKAK